MNKNIRKLALVSAVLISAGIISGCATTTRVEALENRVTSLETKVDGATQAARDAAASVQALRDGIAGAQNTANQALNAANAAQACCDANSEKVERMFRKGMAK